MAAIAAGLFAVLDPDTAVRGDEAQANGARADAGVELEAYRPSRSPELTDAAHWMIYDIIVDGKNYRLELNRVDGRWKARVDGA